MWNRLSCTARPLSFARSARIRRPAWIASRSWYTRRTARWRGDAERAFAAKLLLVLGEFRAIHAFVDEFAGLLERFADQYEAFDASLAAKIDLAE